MKHCNGCNQDLPYAEFARKGNGYQSRCLECHRLENRRWYEANKDATRQRNNQTRKRLMKWYSSLKEGRSCADCGVEYPPYVMQWDHLPGEIKEGCVIDVLVRTSNRQAVLNEIAKCDLVCANCHAERTHCRLGELANPPDSESGDF